MPRPKFTIRSLLVATLVVAAFFAGAAWQQQRMVADRWVRLPDAKEGMVALVDELADLIVSGD